MATYYASVTLRFPEAETSHHVWHPFFTAGSLRTALATRLGLDESNVAVGNFSAERNPYFTYVWWGELVPPGPSRPDPNPLPVRPNPPDADFPELDPIDTVAPIEAIPPIQVAGLMTYATLARSVGGLMARVIWPYLVRAAVGSRVVWARLPGWVRTILEGVGVVAAADFFLGDDAPSDLPPPSDDLPALPPANGVGLGPVPPLVGGVQVLSAWNANGIWFVRLADGRLGAQNKRGVWKLWRPKKPIVLHSDGAGSLRLFLRGDKALNRQAKALSGALKRRAPARRSSAGSGHVQVLAHLPKERT